jgi:hypothetical protein
MAIDITSDFIKGQPKEDTVRDFYCALGQAISTWQSVESALLEVLRAATDPQVPGALNAAFHSLQFNGQLIATDAAVQFALRCNVYTLALTNRWDALRTKLDNKQKRRNALVHFAAYNEPQQTREHEKVYLEPNFTDTRYGRYWG